MIMFLLSIVLVAQSSGSVILNEVMYNPDGSTLGLDEHLEWYELYNNSSEGINLAGMMLSDGNNQVFLSHYLLAPGAYGVVCADAFSFEVAYGPDVKIIPWSGEWTRLRNSTDEVLFYSEDGTVLETLRYDQSWGANGTQPSAADGDGASLERISFDGPNDPSNWQPSEDYANPTLDNDDAVCWGTPGAVNSISD